METISVHGREAYSALIKSVVGVTNIDIGDFIIYFECPIASIRKRLIPDLVDTTALRLILTRDEVALLSTVPSPFVFIDETTDLPKVIKSGLIHRYGYIGSPI